jgi:hypothetical protein
MKQNINNYEFIEPGSGTMPKDDDSGAPPAAMPSPKTKKSGIVTKEELAKSGYDNLRDYLNAKQGLTRRKEKDPTAGDSPDKAAQEAADAIDPGRDMRTPRYTPPGSAPKQTTQQPKPKVFMPSKPDNSFSGSKFAKGGSVSSASSRADGCATKGKTKGTMIKMNYGGKC